jgi:hypothetical protein
MIKLLYKPLGLLVSVLGAVVASTLFNRLWKLLGHDEDAPDATDHNRRWPEVLASATLQGAVFGLVKAAIDRGAATGFRKLTGTWPGT